MSLLISPPQKALISPPQKASRATHHCLNRVSSFRLPWFHVAQAGLSFTTSEEGDSRLDSFHKLLHRTMCCCHLNPALGQYLIFPNNRNQLETKFPARRPFLSLLSSKTWRGMVSCCCDFGTEGD